MKAKANISQFDHIDMMFFESPHVSNLHKIIEGMPTVPVHFLSEQIS